MGTVSYSFVGGKFQIWSTNLFHSGQSFPLCSKLKSFIGLVAVFYLVQSPNFFNIPFDWTLEKIILTNKNNQSLCLDKIKSISKGSNPSSHLHIYIFQFILTMNGIINCFSFFDCLLAECWEAIQG